MNDVKKILTAKKDEPLPTAEPAAHPAMKANLERTRKQLRAEQEAQAANGMVRIAPMVGLDIVPNRIRSTPPDPITVKPEDCWVDRKYQRDALTRKSAKLIYNIVSDWQWSKFKPPVITRDTEDRYIIIDGQHTAIAAATHPDIKTIPAMFVPLEDVDDQARSFIGHNTNRIPVASLDLYHARITAGEPLAVNLDHILKEYGIRVVRTLSGSSHPWEPNQTVATGVIMKMLDKHGPIKFASIAEFVSQCGFTPIKADHWRFAESLLVGQDKVNIYNTSMMLEVINAVDQNDALNEGAKIANSLDVAKYQGLLIYYKNRYTDMYRITRPKK